MALLPTISPLLFLIPAHFLFLQHASAANKFQNETDRLALLDFKNQISNDPNNIRNSWNDSKHHCQWPGVKCDSVHGRVMALNLGGQSLSGPISPHIGNLTFLKHVDLQNNSFSGVIPVEVGSLFRLRYLNLAINNLQGEIPANLSQCLKLRFLNFFQNQLEGKIPSELGSLKNLITLDLGRNNLTGELPHFFGNLSLLEELSVEDNHLSGNLPEEIGHLASLILIDTAENNITGKVPFSLYNVSSIVYLSFVNNLLHDSVPSDLGLKLPNLIQFFIGRNKFYGTIPASISNASHLEEINLGSNNFNGNIPSNIGNLRNIQWLKVESNFLGSNSTGDLNFISYLSNCSKLEKLYLGGNNFGGSLPHSIGNLSHELQVLDLQDNQITGVVPEGLDNLANLFQLGMNGNLFSGDIPGYFAKLQKVQQLLLGGNFFSGEIPSYLCNITALYTLTLYENRLQGHLSPSIGNCQNMKDLRVYQNNLRGTIPPQIFSIPSFSTILDLSHNSFSGSLPPEVGKLKNIIRMDFSENKLSGEIPETIGDCTNLEYLSMQGNFFRGKIPSKLSSLIVIEHLDLSRNNLTGQIPKELESLLFLHYLNLSFNDLEGEVPRNGPFANASIVSLVGNSKLCGGIPELQLPSCKKRPAPLLEIALSCTALITILASASFCILHCRRTRVHSSSISPRIEEFPRISYRELHQATEGFSSGNLIGSGSFGSVYKGKLNQGEKLVAVKVLNLQKHGAPKSFMVECRALRNIRHRNLVPIWTCFSGSDFKGSEFKALVYEFMANGDLDTWLHPKSTEITSSKKLNIFQRLNIAIDVAFAVNYLHNHCQTPIIHCDLKPSNVLLDKELTVHVGDFGLARILSSVSSQQQSSSTGIKGSIGYAAPEYGTGGSVSTLGDVYSYGILLLELLTGRRPTDDLFRDSFDLHDYVVKSLPAQVMKIVDPSLYMEEEDEFSTITGMRKYSNDTAVFCRRGSLQKCLISIFRIGLACSSRSPRERISMDDVVNGLQLVKQTFFHNETDETC